MEMKRVWSLILAILLLTLAACGKGPEGNKESTAAQEQQGVYYNTYLTADPISMDISKISDTYSSNLVNNVMESLVRMGERNGNYTIIPGDALTWESNADGTVWTFRLGENTWSDGQPVLAQDYVYSLRRSADPRINCPNEYYLLPVAGYQQVRDGAPVESLGVQALDEKTLQITLSYPVPSFLEMCCGTIYYPQRQDIVERYGELYGTEPEYTLYNGPYTLESWNHDAALTLKKREDYWNAKNVQIETVNIHILEDSATVCAMFEAGQLDNVSTSSAEWVEKFMNREDTTYVKSYGAAVNYIFYNTKDPLLCNANVRRAFSMAIDREELNQVAFGGRSNPATGWVSPSMSVGPISYRGFAGNMIQAMYGEAREKNMTARDYLLLGMKELGLGEDPSILNVTFSLAGTDAWFRTLGEYLQRTYREALGIELKVSYTDWSAFSDNLASGNYQMGYMGWSANYNDPYDVLSLFMSTNDSIQNGWSNREFDKLVLKAQKEMDEAKRLQLYQEAEAILLLEEYVVNPVLFPSSNNFYRNYVDGYLTLAYSTGGYQTMTIGERPE